MKQFEDDQAEYPDASFFENINNEIKVLAKMDAKELVFRPESERFFVLNFDLLQLVRVGFASLLFVSMSPVYLGLGHSSFWLKR